MKNKRFKELDALRGLAALMVVLFHFTIGKEEAEWGFKIGITGVDLFFMISGFVILLSLENIQKSGQFIINRISRLYPTYWVSVSVTFLVIILYQLYIQDFDDKIIQSYLANLSMFQYYLNIPHLDESYWTLIIEMLFYIFMYFLFRFGVLKNISKIGFILMIFIVLIAYSSIHASWLNVFFDWIPFIQFWPLFFSGILFYKIITTNDSHLKYYGMITLCLVSQILLYFISGNARYFIGFWEYTLALTFYFSLFTLFVNQKLLFIVNKPTLFLGKISFALYLTHQTISVEYVIPFLMNSFRFSFWLSSGIALVFSIGIAAFITYFIEIPYSRKMREKLYERFYK